MKTNMANDSHGLSQPPTKPIVFTYLNQILPIAIGHSSLREESDGFVPLLVAVTLIACALLLALD
jgi:hypothetical protein